ncbi:hypothetical protein GOODEAATRI_026619 [Goodea atripinnis]|uniref:Uncharacterized protein n=1 Tax=Goodea atripinnis TaxID=208336 RepID=A0ABV0NQY4_9TELE
MMKCFERQGTAWREIYTFSPGFSRASESSPDAVGTVSLYRPRAPLSGRTHSRAPCPSQRKENSPGAPSSFSGSFARHLSPPLQIRGSDLTPFRSAGGDVGHRPASSVMCDRWLHSQYLNTNSTEYENVKNGS